MAGQHQLHVMLAKQRHVLLPNYRRWRLDDRSAMWSRRKSWVMADNHNVYVAPPIETFELLSNPVELRGVVSDDRIEEQHERVAIPDGVRWIPLEAARGRLVGDQPAVRREVVL